LNKNVFINDNWQAHSGEKLGTIKETLIQSYADKTSNFFSRTYSQQLESYKNGLSEAKKSLEDVQRKVRETESMIAAKDKIINDLRLQVCIELVLIGKCRRSISS
jgi:hypothetical protein